jgi:5-methylcytosine-specific restriction protein A
MSRLITIKPRVQMAESRKLASIADGQADTWGSGRGGRPWRRKRDTILLRDRYTCQQCGHIGTDLEVDHIINVARGGTDDDDNLQSLCIPCHKRKTAQESSMGGRG